MGVLLLTQSFFFTWLYHSVLLITTPNMTQLLVKTSLYAPTGAQRLDDDDDDEEASSHLAWFLSLSQVWYFFLPRKGTCLIIKPITYHKKQMGLQMQFPESSGHEWYSSLISNRLQKAFARDREEQLICFTFEGVNLLLVLQCSLLWFL